MSSRDEVIRISKYLSRHLRHAPERIGLKLEPGGWVSVDELLQACARNAMPLSREKLNEVVASNDKQRFSFDESGTRIRANQGHSVAVDLQLPAQTPPVILFHGTAQINVEGIREQGLMKMGRHHVHLSSDVETARRVGARHGKPVVFEVDAVAMHAVGLAFFRSDNGVWLADNVPPQYLHLPDEPQHTKP